MVSPTMMFYRDRLHLRHFPDSIHKVFFKALDMCGILHEPIMLLVEKRFHIERPVDGGSQQLYNMLWDVDIRPEAQKCIVPPRISDEEMVERTTTYKPTSWNPPPVKPLYEEEWKEYRDNYFNPGMPNQGGMWLSRGTLWLQDDLSFLCKKYVVNDQYEQMEVRNTVVYKPGQCSLYSLDSTKSSLVYGLNRKGEHHATEVLDLSNIPEEKRELFKPREFYFKVFEPKEYEPDDELISSDSELDDFDEEDFAELDSTQRGLLDSTLDFEEDDKEMNKIVAFFANMPKVTNLIQGMLDMMTGLTNILPLVVQKLDKPEDDGLKTALTRTVDLINKGADKVLKICRFLGIKVVRKQSNAINHIVKDRFKKHKKEFIEYEIEELNKTIDALEEVDSKGRPLPPGPPPPDITPNNLYPQRMPLKPMPPPPPKPDPVHEFLS